MTNALTRAAEEGAAAAIRHNADMVSSYTLGVAVARASNMQPKVRSRVRLPGRGDVVTAACYVLGGTNDNNLATVLLHVSPVAAREQRVNAVDKVIGDSVRAQLQQVNPEFDQGHVVARIFEIIADLILCYGAQKLLGRLQLLETRETELVRREANTTGVLNQLKRRIALAAASAAAKDCTIRALQAQLETEQKERNAFDSAVQIVPPQGALNGGELQNEQTAVADTKPEAMVMYVPPLVE